MRGEDLPAEVRAVLDDYQRRIDAAPPGTGGIIGKAAGCEYAAERWPEYADLLRRSRAWRDGDTVTFTAADGLRAVEFVELVRRTSEQSVEVVIADAANRQPLSPGDDAGHRLLGA